MSVFTLVKQQYILEPVVTFATHCFKTFGLTNIPKILYELKRRACLEPSSAFLKLHSILRLKFYHWSNTRIYTDYSVHTDS